MSLYCEFFPAAVAPSGDQDTTYLALCLQPSAETDAFVLPSVCLEGPVKRGGDNALLVLWSPPWFVSALSEIQ